MQRIFIYFLFLFSLFFQSGCGFPYVVKQGLIHLSHLQHAKPIKKILENPSQYQLTSEEIRKLSLIQEVQKFAIEKVGLKASKNYTTYVKFPDNRLYLVYVVSACEKYKLEPYGWSFLFVGKMPYKGFFELADAKELAQKLEKEGLDIYVRGSIAFSTLGWFSDPVYSTMLRLDDLSLIETIFHEMTHDTVYLKGEGDFNESLANFVGVEATLLYIAAREGIHSTLYQEMLNKVSDAKLFSKFIKDVTDKLEVLYKDGSHPHESGDPAKDAMPFRKENIFRESQKDYKNYGFKTKEYDFYQSLKLNNAVILAFKTYYDDFPKFEKRFEKVGKNLPNFIKSYQED